MITAGIDMGAKTIKVVIVEDNKALGQSIIPTGFEPLESAQKALEEAIKKHRCQRKGGRLRQKR
jgi:activator of 2-hydroxyglutaryl-CoA dehydratase